MSNRIHLGQVPRTTNGQISYAMIPDMEVRMLVAEEELHQLSARIKRLNTPSDYMFKRRDEAVLATLQSRRDKVADMLATWKTIY